MIVKLSQVYGETPFCKELNGFYWSANQENFENYKKYLRARFAAGRNLLASRRVKHFKTCHQKRSVDKLAL
jgi:hypothetical protein